MADFYFYDLPVYRLTEEKYYKQRDEYVERVLFPPELSTSASIKKRDSAEPSKSIGIRDHLSRRYGGAWIFNEIIGYIRLHFLGNQIRGEYISVLRSRIVRTRTKVFEFNSYKLAPEICIPHNSTNAEILTLINRYIDNCRKEIKRRHIDTELFALVAPHIDWRSLYFNNTSNNLPVNR